MAPETFEYYRRGYKFVLLAKKLNKMTKEGELRWYLDGEKDYDVPIFSAHIDYCIYFSLWAHPRATGMLVFKDFQVDIYESNSFEIEDLYLLAKDQVLGKNTNFVKEDGALEAVIELLGVQTQEPDTETKFQIIPPSQPLA
ncbi:MAG: hypothetical protein KGL39_37660 [Patescibacteria group bacterium]|nr:hypothetical protein [Patescibacteria group bacterium]